MKIVALTPQPSQHQPETTDGKGGRLLNNFRAVVTAKKQAARSAIAEQMFRLGLQSENEASVSPAPGKFLRNALHEYKTALRYNPGLSAAHVNIGCILRKDMEKPLKAAPHFLKAILIHPGYALAHYNFATCCDDISTLPLMQSKPNKAAALEFQAMAYTHYMKAIEIDPGYADAHFNLAAFLEERKLYWQAIPHWKKYLESGDTDTDSIVAAHFLLAKCRRKLVRSGTRDFAPLPIPGAGLL